MMAADIGLLGFLASYAFLLVVLGVMKLCHIQKTALVAVAGMRMTIQMGIMGYVLTYIIRSQSVWLVLACLLVMIAFAIYRVLSMNRWMNRRFMVIAGASLAAGGFIVLGFYLLSVVDQPISAGQYTIPLAGMVFGNAMTGLNLGLKSLREALAAGAAEINALLNVGGEPRDILLPFINQALETAILPTVNIMVGMGIVSLPGMMGGQIIAGISPEKAILYQMSISMGLSAAVCLSCFAALYIGVRTLYNKDKQIEMVK